MGRSCLEALQFFRNSWKERQSKNFISGSPWLFRELQAPEQTPRRHRSLRGCFGQKSPLLSITMGVLSNSWSNTADFDRRKKEQIDSAKDNFWWSKYPRSKALQLRDIWEERQSKAVRNTIYDSAETCKDQNQKEPLVKFMRGCLWRKRKFIFLSCYEW